MGELEDRLGPDEENKLSDSAALGRSRSIMSMRELTEYAGAAYAAYLLIEARVGVLDSAPGGFLTPRLDAEAMVKLAAAGAAGRVDRLLNAAELSDFAGALYLAYDALAARVGTLESAPAGTVMQGALEAADEVKLAAAGAAGRTGHIMSSVELTEWAGATQAVYASLDARVLVLEGAS